MKFFKDQNDKLVKQFRKKLGETKTKLDQKMAEAEGASSSSSTGASISVAASVSVTPRTDSTVMLTGEAAVLSEITLEDKLIKLCANKKVTLNRIMSKWNKLLQDSKFKDDEASLEKLKVKVLFALARNKEKSNLAIEFLENPEIALEVNIQDELGNTLFHVAAETGDLALFKYCRTSIAIDTRNQSNQTALHVAVANYQVAILNECLKLSANVTEQASFSDMQSFMRLGKEAVIKMPPLHYAVLMGYEEIVKNLIEYLIKNNNKNHLKLSVGERGNLIHLAVEGGQMGVLQYLLENKTLRKLVNSVNGLNFTPVGMAAYLGLIEMIDELIKSGVETETELLSPSDETKLPILHCAVYSCDHLNVMRVVQYFANYPAALKSNLDKEYPVKQLPHLDYFGVDKKNDDNVNPFRLAQTLAQGLRAQADTQKKRQALELGKIQGLLTNLKRLAGSAQFNDKPSTLKVIHELIGDDLKRCYTNLVLQGGGPKGIAYIGAIKVLEENLGKGLPHIRRVAGTSAGAITAVALALGLSHDEILKELTEKKITDFIEGSFDPKKVIQAVDKPSLSSVLSNALDIVYRKFTHKHETESLPKAAFHALREAYYMDGLCSGTDFRDWLDDLIKRYTGVKHLTFKELRELVRTPSSSQGATTSSSTTASATISTTSTAASSQPRHYKHLVIAMTQLLPTEGIRIIDSEHLEVEEEELIVSDVVRASMSIPGVFSPHRLRFKRSNGQVQEDTSARYVDGGLLYNYPIQIFDNVQNHPFGFGDRDTSSFAIPNHATLGLSLYAPEIPKERNDDDDDDKVPPSVSIDNVKELLKALGNIYYNAEAIYGRLQRPIDQSRTININNLGVSLVEFDIPKDKQEALIAEGEKEAKAFLAKALGNVAQQAARDQKSAQAATSTGAFAISPRSNTNKSDKKDALESKSTKSERADDPHTSEESISPKK